MPEWIITAENMELGDNDPVKVLDTEHFEKINYHSHDFCELVYVKEGYTVHYYGEHATVLTEGDLFAVSPGVKHAYTGLHYTKVYNCIFIGELFGADLPLFRGMPGVCNLFSETGDETMLRMRLDTPDRIKVISLMEKIKEESLNSLPDRTAMEKALLSQLLIIISRLYTKSYSFSESELAHMNYVLKVLSYIEEHYREDIDLNSMAAHVDISPDYLSRQFKKAIGMSPVLFLRGCRFARAMEIMRLSGGKENFEEVAHKVGYRYLSHFSREFKAFTGLSPTEFKKTLI